MTHQVLSDEPPSRLADGASVLDERSMRFLELALAGVALLAATLLTIAR